MNSENEGYVWVRDYTMKKVKIPEGSVKCKACEGSGELRRYYGQPWDRGQFMACWYCHGQGYVDKEWADELDKTDRMFWGRRP